MSLSKNSAPKLNKKEERKISLLDLPESTLDCILEYLLPMDLCNVAKVCTFFRYRCRRDCLWEKQVKQKWGNILGDNAYREWQWHVRNIANKKSPFLQINKEGLLGCFSGTWPQLSLGSYLENPWELSGLLLSNSSMMALYISLQSGRFWFPAQMYRRVKVYDVLLSYNHITNTFRARPPTGGWHLIEENVQWERLRISPNGTLPYDLYVSECLNDLKPGDHIEIQRKRRNDEPYEWYYAVIDHLESCDKDNQNHCGCKHSDVLMVLLEQNQYRPRSWRRAELKRKVNGEQSNGYWLYGGIRKLVNEEEIQRWNRFRTTLPRRDLIRLRV